LLLLLFSSYIFRSSTKHTFADHDRPLNKRGKRDAPKIGNLLKEKDLVPDLIISSTAVRAKRTAKMVAKASKYKGNVTQ
jgi:phosphohistidine phosphatase